VKVIYGLETVDPSMSGSVLTIGNFDGVNRAHQQLLAQAGMLAADGNRPVVVLTFEPHPLTLLAPHQAPKLLTPRAEKTRLLGEAGADCVVIAEVTPKFLATEAEVFVRDVLVQHFHPLHIVEGPNFGFGRGRKGNNETLRRLGGELGFETCVVEPLKLVIEGREPVVVSSTLCRTLLSEGRIRQAGICLGRPYTLIGEVVEGDQRGRTMGFPTANLRVSEQLIPAEGVYAGRAVLDDGTLRAAAISIGANATFQGQTTRVEVHLLDFDGELYGRTLRTEFWHRIRGHVKFESPERLVEQIRSDVAEVRRRME